MRRIGFVVSIVLIAGRCLVEAAQPEGATLVVTVLDPSGAQVPSARLEVTAERQPRMEGSRTFTSASGRIVAEGLEPGVYTIRVEAPGFAPATLARVAVRGEVQRSVRLDLAPLAASVVVERDRRDAALDPRGFSTFLSREQIDALPDDPEAFAQALQALAPPGAVIRVDGFTGGSMPPKSQILSIRVPRIDSYAAEEHGGLGGLSFIEIVTTPGGGRVEGSVEAAMQHHALNARNPLAPDRGRELSRSGGVALDGPLVRERASFAASLRAGRQEDTTAIHAVMPDGRVLSEPITRPVDALALSARATLALPAGHTLRAGVSSERRTSRNLGIGDINLHDRGFEAASSDVALRVSSSGPLGHRAYVESRLQARWSGTRTASSVERPAVRVLEAFATGGAQVTGGARATELLAAVDADYARGVHAWRAGALVETGGYRSNRQSNYLGTYTFASLDDYRAGRPASYTRRAGNPNVRYRNAQIGLYVQDDYRVLRSLLVSFGVRYERQALTGGAGRFLPRAGLSWSPFPTGGTTLRASGGLFSEWLSMPVYEQSLALDGSRQNVIQVPHPPYPDPPRDEASAPVLPRDRYYLDERVRLPSVVAFSAGIEQQLGAGLRVYAGYARRLAHHLLRGDNLNAPLAGVRPDPLRGNIVRARSDARLRSHRVTVHLATIDPAARLSIAAAYVFNDARSNSSGAFAVPASGRLDAEWGPTTPAHAVTGTLGLRAPRGLTFSFLPQWRSGQPYTITTGRDDNGDGLFTDRPSGLARNSARTTPQWEIGARVSMVLQFGRSRGLGFDRDAAVAGGQGSGPAPPGSSAAANGRYRVELFAFAQNVTNRPNYVSVGSVIGSPFFGKPTVALNPRRLQLGLRLRF